MRLKSGVKLTGLQPQTVLALSIAERVYERHGLEPVVTSVNDSRHGPRSLHAAGAAFDLRLPSRCAAEAGGRAWGQSLEPVDRDVHRELASRLGECFDAVLEQHQASAFDWHLHVEFDPPI